MYLDSELGDTRLNKKHEKPEHDCDYCNHSQELFRALLLPYESLFLTLTPQEVPASTSSHFFFFLQSAPTDAASADIKPSCFSAVGEKTSNHTDLHDQTIHNGRRTQGTISHHSNDTKKREQEQKLETDESELHHYTSRHHNQLKGSTD